METTEGHKNVALIPWRNKRDKYNIKHVIYMLTMRGGKKRVKEISRKETTYPFELVHHNYVIGYLMSLKYLQGTKDEQITEC